MEPITSRKPSPVSSCYRQEGDFFFVFCSSLCFRVTTKWPCGKKTIDAGQVSERDAWALTMFRLRCWISGYASFPATCPHIKSSRVLQPRALIRRWWSAFKGRCVTGILPQLLLIVCSQFEIKIFHVFSFSDLSFTPNSINILLIQ